MAAALLSVGVDIGGTFTDVVVATDGKILVAEKIPSTPHALVEAVREGVVEALRNCGKPPATVDRFIHGSTVATNALLERRGDVLGLLATSGFEDVLEIGRQLRPREYLYRFDPPAQTPVFLAPKRRRRGIAERVDATGEVLIPLDDEQVAAVASELIEREGVTGFAICFLFSFLYPKHEQRARDVIRAHYPDVHVSVSCEVNPVIREYERMCMTCTDAYIRPSVQLYLHQLKQMLVDLGIAAHLEVMQSRGAVAGGENALARPVTLVASGPAAGVRGAIAAGKQCDIADLITIDMGGTSSDAALVVEGEALITQHGVMREFPLRMPMIDVNSIGAGGGSIAWLDSGGGLRVGPRSAGSDPGPACYGRSGTAATVTDASLVLGYINPVSLAGGTLRLDRKLAAESLRAVGSPLGLSITETALGIHRIVNARMADQVRLLSVGRGYDPRRFTLVAFGGAGPIHGAAIASDLAIPLVIVPNRPGVLSAYGLLTAKIEQEQTRTFVARTDEVIGARAARVLAELEVEVRRLMAAEKVPSEAMTITRSADLRYVGQSYELEVPLRDGANSIITSAVTGFHRAHTRVYGHCRPDAPLEFINLRVTASYALAREESVSSPRRRIDAPPESASRPTHFPDYGAPMDTPVYMRKDLGVGFEVSGPTIIEQADSTTVIPPRWTCNVHETGTLILAPAGGPPP